MVVVVVREQRFDLSSWGFCTDYRRKIQHWIFLLRRTRDAQNNIVLSYIFILVLARVSGDSSGEDPPTSIGGGWG